MIQISAIAAAVVLAGGLLAFAILRRADSTRGQTLALAVAASVLPTIGIVAAGLIMFSRHDAVVLAVVAAVSAGTAAILAALVAGKLSSGVRVLHDTAAQLARGNLSARAPEVGTHETRELAHAMNDMAAKLQRLFETRRNLVAWASHDLRAPLSALQAMIEALEDGLARPDQYLPTMRAQVRMLSRLVDDLFEVSKIEMGTLELSAMDVSLDDIATECMRLLKPEAERLGVRLSVSNGDAVRARCDPDRIERVLLNLMTNALRHTPEDGTVAVRLARNGDVARVAVEDDGRGIAPAALERVFESFWRADPARSAETGGAGLGLAIARGIVEAHHGRIWAENRAEGGARFVFTLPAGASARG